MVRTILPLFAFALAASAPALASENVPVSWFNSLELVGGGEVLVQKGPVQRVTIVEGSSQFTSIRVASRGRLKINACNASCPHSYRLKILVETPGVPVLAVDGGGKITTTQGFGGQKELTAAVNGGGVIDATALAAEVATAAVHGGGEIKVRAVRVLTAAVNGGGTIRYWGDPQVTTAISGGGTVRPAR